MIKKKAKGKAAAKKAAKKKSAPKGEKEFDPAQVRMEISKLVGSQAETLAQAVIEEGKKGQVSPVKYLFEMASIFPPLPEGEQGTSNEESLAQTLLRRLNLPVEPIKRDEDDETQRTVSVTNPTVKAALDGEYEGKGSGPEPKLDDESKNPVLV